MATEITSQLPPCPLPDCEGGEHRDPRKRGDGMSTFGHLNGQLTLTIAGNAINLGHVQVPVTGFFDRGQLTLTANTRDVADTVRELFAQSSAPEVGGDGQ